MAIKKLLMTALCLVSFKTFAHPPSPNIFDNGNLWEVTAYNDALSDHAVLTTQELCFSPYSASGTQIHGRWYSPTFAGWSGRYAQEGDQLFLYGNFNADAGHDGMVLEIVTNDIRNIAAGHWQEWIEDGSYGATIAFVNVKMTRIGSCTGEQQAPAVIPPRMLRDGTRATHPLQEGQLPLN